VEPDDAAPQETLEQLLAERADAESLRVGPGDVPEGQDGGARQALADEPRRQREVVVLHQDDGVLAVGFRADRVGEAAVHLLVMLEVLAPEAGPRVRDMAERPQAFVGEPVVVAPLLLRGEPDPADRVRLLAGGHADAGVAVAGLAVGVAAAVRDPHARAGAHHRLEGGHQAAGRVEDAHAPVGIPFVDVRLAVGDHDHLLAPQMAAQHVAQPLRRPGAGALRGASFGGELLGELADVLQERLELRAVARPAHQAVQLVPEPPEGGARRRGRAENRREKVADGSLALKALPHRPLPGRLPCGAGSGRGQAWPPGPSEWSDQIEKPRLM